MHPFLIHLANSVWMVVVLVGVPAVTSAQVGSIRLSAMPEFRMLTLGGLALGAACNLVAGFLASGKSRRVYWAWALPYSAGWIIYLLLFNRQINFGWLKEALLWLKRTLS